MTIDEAYDYIFGVSWMGSQPGLERVSELLDRLGSPQNKLRFVHIAGTNGKGSTAAMLTSILTAAGYKTGLNISPHLDRVNERISVNCRDISDSELIRAVTAVMPHAEAMRNHPTEFEMLTAIAIWHFAEVCCDIVIMEAGLGGRLDATNVIPPPECAVITAIGLDHIAELGDTLAAIAREKAGIIKPGSDVVSYIGGGVSPLTTSACGRGMGADEASDTPQGVIAEVCRRRGCHLRIPDFGAITQLSRSLSGQSFTYKNSGVLNLPLIGAHQLKNAATALEAAAVLRERGFDRLTDGAIAAGLAATRWPARFEVVSAHDPAFIVDGGHNPQCAGTIADAIREYFPGQAAVFLIGLLADKDCRTFIETLAPLASAFVTVTPDSNRAIAAADLAAYISAVISSLRGGGTRVETADSIADGVARAIALAGRGGLCVSCGSLYMAGDVRAQFDAKED